MVKLDIIVVNKNPNSGKLFDIKLLIMYFVIYAIRIIGIVAIIKFVLNQEIISLESLENIVTMPIKTIANTNKLILIIFLFYNFLLIDLLNL